MTWKMIRTKRAPGRGERGAGLVEYSLLVALIAVVCIVAVTFLGTSHSGKFDRAGNAIKGTEAPGCYPTRTAEASGYPAYYTVNANGVRSAVEYGYCPGTTP